MIRRLFPRISSILSSDDSGRAIEPREVIDDNDLSYGSLTMGEPSRKTFVTNHCHLLMAHCYLRKLYQNFT